ncbi:hypothetical protein DAPPUDRAFT_249267 [Daphnia pulex]|uniref:Uncharacterized protein n=1 Tax=Daphnia pulex TaxID=6669 RepID=E9GWA6_DAPPU|nr:hypothetical protein DAPPUDRAFT_249267 [Daphnia pulex]|eukprot:EFX76229.1 hypothetical protein DAPPUDRAFT_249267 [Daphnia pulex]
MYASDDTASAVANRLLPISPALTPSDGTVTDGRQQPMAVYYSAMYLQPPPAASYTCTPPLQLTWLPLYTQLLFRSLLLLLRSIYINISTTG